MRFGHKLFRKRKTLIMLFVLPFKLLMWILQVIKEAKTNVSINLTLSTYKKKYISNKSESSEIQMSYNGVVGWVWCELIIII